MLPESYKLYIAVLDEVPDHMVPVLVAHSVLGAHIKWYNISEEASWSSFDYCKWLKHSFKKVVLKMNRKEFNKLLENEDCRIYTGHENSTLNGETSCIVVCPQESYPNVIKFAKMWKPTLVSDS